MENYNYPGRPIKPNAITRTGRSVRFYLSQRDYKMFEVLLVNRQMTMSDCLRDLIAQAYFDLQDNK